MLFFDWLKLEASYRHLLDMRIEEVALQQNEQPTILQCHSHVVLVVYYKLSACTLTITVRVCSTLQHVAHTSHVGLVIE